MKELVVKNIGNNEENLRDNEHDYYPWDWDLKGFWENKEYFEIQQNILVDVLENGGYSKFVTEFLERVVECTKKLRQIK